MDFGLLGFPERGANHFNVKDLEVPPPDVPGNQRVTTLTTLSWVSISRAKLYHNQQQRLTLAWHMLLTLLCHHAGRH